jgi:hypothetical protein
VLLNLLQLEIDVKMIDQKQTDDSYVYAARMKLQLEKNIGWCQSKDSASGYS